MSHALEFSALSKKCGETGIHMTFRTFFGSVHPGGLFFTPSMEEVRLVFTPSMEEVQESFDAIPNLARKRWKIDPNYSIFRSIQVRRTLLYG